MDASGSWENSILSVFLICFNPSFYMDASGRNDSRTAPPGTLSVSILVSIWMHLEVVNEFGEDYTTVCFNPSFYMDASGRVVCAFYKRASRLFQS